MVPSADSPSLTPPPPPHTPHTQAFVAFADVESASKAKEAIHGRLFAGIVVQVTYLTAEMYEQVL